MHKKPHIVGLDSLRCFAIVLIIIYHCFPGALTGGFIAVELFFLISGFLIGSKLIREPNNRKFLPTRILRLLPPLLICMIITLTLAYFADPDLLVKARSNSLYALTFSTNLANIINGTSYESALTPNLFNHTWFLALELQVCLLAYLVFTAFFYLFGNHKTPTKKLSYICILLGVSSFILMGIFGWHFGLFDRAYFGLDTHIGAFFFGAALAARHDYRKFNPRRITRNRWFWMAISLLCLAALSVLAFTSEYSAKETFVVVLPLAAVLSYPLVLSILKLQTTYAAPKFLRPFEYLGKISFYLYLFHWPLYLIFKNFFFASLPWLVAPLTILISLGLSVFTDKLALPFIKKHKIASLVILALALIVPVLSLIKAPTVSKIEESINAGAEISTSEELTDEQTPDYSGVINFSETLTGDILPYFSASTAFAKINVVKTTTTARKTSSSITTNVQSLGNARVLVIGDSVVLGAKGTILSTVSGSYVDAAKNRQMSKAISLLASYRAKNNGNLPYTIVIGLATNYSNFSAATLQSILNAAGDGHQFVFITAYAGSQPRDSQNNLLKNFAASHANVRVADWASIAVNNLGAYTWSDNIHLRPAGAAAYANLINSTIGGL